MRDVIGAKPPFVLALAAGISLLVAACDGGTSTSGRPITASPSTSTSATEPGVREISEVPYQQDPDGTRHELTVYAPATEGGPWPVAVMVHGCCRETEDAGVVISAEPSAVARQGLVVFVPAWAWPDPSWASAETVRAQANVVIEQTACAVRFARTEAGRYGGDPSNLSLYGESGGAFATSMVAFAEPMVAEGCVAASGPVVPDNLVLFEGDWLLLAFPQWDRLLQEDPRLMDAVTPWAYLGESRMPVHILDSDDPTVVSVEDEDRWLTPRDHTGTFRRDLGELGAFDDGVVEMRETQRLLYGRLQNLGYEVSFHHLPHSTHDSLSEAGMQVVVEAILRQT